MRALLIAAAALLLTAPAAEARKSQFTIFEAGREIRSHDFRTLAQVLDEIQGFGVRWIRVVMYWRDVRAPMRRRTSTRLIRAATTGRPTSGSSPRHERVVCASWSRRAGRRPTGQR